MNKKKVGFRDECSCGSDLHVCKNCKHYDPSKPAQCNIPDIDRVRDKEKRNFCEEFVPGQEQPNAKKSLEIKKNNFNSLFKKE